VPTYRIVLRDAQHVIKDAKDFECATDEAAIEQARQLVDGHDVELYDHGRFITWFRSPDLKRE